MSRSIPAGCHSKAVGNVRFSIWDFLLTYLLGRFPYPSFPALCHDDTAFHGATDCGEHAGKTFENARDGVLHGCPGIRGDLGNVIPGEGGGPDVMAGHGG